MLQHFPTLQDVAESAQVSVSTASRALRGQAQVAEETRRRVELAAQRLGYRGYREVSEAVVDEPAAHGRERPASAAIPGLQRLAVVSEKGTHRFFAEMMLELMRIGRERSFDTDVHTDYTLKDSDDVLHVVKDCDADAIVLITWRNVSAKDAKLFQEAPVPVVLVNRYIEGMTFSVTLDDFAAGVQAANYLHGLGHRCIGHLMGNQEVLPIRERTSGFRTGLKRLGLYHPEHFIQIEREDRFGSIQRAVATLLGREDRCTAVWGWNDATAAEALSVIRANGLRVPEDVSVMGFDRTETLEQIELSTFDFRMRELGLSALFLLEGIFRKWFHEPVHIRLTPRFIPGKTTGPIGAHHV